MALNPETAQFIDKLVALTEFNRATIVALFEQCGRDQERTEKAISKYAPATSLPERTFELNLKVVMDQPSSSTSSAFIEAKATLMRVPGVRSVLLVGD